MKMKMSTQSWTIRMVNQLLSSAVLSLSCLTLLVASANAELITTIIDDHFDDGNFGTNTGGTGTGFTVYQSNSGYYSESGGLAIVKGDGARRASIESKESVDATGTDTVRFQFQGVRFTDLGAIDGTYGPRHHLGVRQKAPAGYTYRASDLGQGFYVQCESTTWSGAWTGTSRFWYINASGAETSLATWQFDTLDLLGTALDGDGTDVSPVLDITIELTADTWALQITGDTRGGGSAISFSGTQNHSVTTGHAYIYNQTDGPNLSIKVDRILVTSIIPEPSTLALLAAGLLGLAVYGWRRRNDE